MEIPNYDTGDNLNVNFEQLYPYVQKDTFRMLLCSCSNSGKTTEPFMPHTKGTFDILRSDLLERQKS